MDNKERLNTKGKEYYTNNKDRLKKQSLELLQCPLCGTCLRKSSLSHHKRTKKCKELKAMRVLYNAFTWSCRMWVVIWASVWLLSQRFSFLSYGSLLLAPTFYFVLIVYVFLACWDILMLRTYYYWLIMCEILLLVCYKCYEVYVDFIFVISVTTFYKVSHNEKIHRYEGFTSLWRSSSSLVLV